MFAPADIHESRWSVALDPGYSHVCVTCMIQYIYIIFMLARNNRYREVVSPMQLFLAAVAKPTNSGGRSGYGRAIETRSVKNGNNFLLFFQDNTGLMGSALFVSC